MTTIDSTRRAAVAGLAATALGLASRGALAQGAGQTYPTRPPRWLVGYPAGGGTDVLARLLAAAMATRLGQQIVVENRPGAATNIAAAEAARAEPDGYTLFSAAVETVVFNPALYKKLSYDPAADFRPVGLSARFQLVLSVAKSSPAKTAREFVDRAKAAPGTINYGSPGVGSPHHLAMERLMRLEGAKLTHVPYRGAAPVLNDMMAGVMESAILDLAAAGPTLRDGVLRPLAICSTKRHPSLPDVPTVEEALGQKGFEAYSWQGVVVPAKTPDPVVARLTEALSAALTQDSVLTRMREIGLDPLPGGPAEYQALLKSEREAWWPVIRDLNLNLD